MKENVIALILLGAAGAASAEPQKVPAQSPFVQALANCRTQTEDAARLRCYDGAISALTSAAEQGKVMVVDQEDVRKTRRSLFGFNLPKLPFFQGDKSGAEAQEELTATIASVRSLPHGRWRLTLEDGAHWETLETSGFIADPRVGNPVLIKRGALGGYMMRIAGQRALRAKRVS